MPNTDIFTNVTSSGATSGKGITPSRNYTIMVTATGDGTVSMEGTSGLASDWFPLPVVTIYSGPGIVVYRLLDTPIGGMRGVVTLTTGRVDAFTSFV